MANVNGTEIDLMPTEGMRAEAQRYRDWKADGEPGGTDVAATRAGQILSGDELSPDTVITMSAWFARHEVDKQGAGFSPGEDGYPSPGRVAWAAWGGDPGKTWADAKATRIKALQERVAIIDSTITAPMAMSRDIQKESFRRSDAVQFVRSGDGEESRAFQFAFSSETPVQRWFGTEVLSHDASAPDLTRLNDGAPLLWNHDPNQVLGVVERGWIDPDKRRGMAGVRFSRSAFAEEKLRDIRDGILRNVSFGYSILETQPGSDGTVHATRWQPMEVSIVSVPADAGVGIGRSLNTPTTAPQQMEQQTVDLAAVRAAAAAEERTRVASITGLCREHGTDDLAQGLIERGASEGDAMREVLATIAKRAKQPAQPATAAAPSRPIAGSADIGLTDKEARSYSFLRAIRAQLLPQERQFQEEAGFEREVSAAAAKRMGMAPRGWVVPNEVMNQRNLTVGTASSAGDLVFTDARPGSFIELLQKRNVLTSLGVQYLTGLQGPVAIPRQTGASTAYWTGEGQEGNESDPSVDQINMTPKQLTGWSRFSRLLLLQSSIDVENMLRTDLTRVLALEMARSSLYGTGTVNQPQGLKFVTGINTVDFAANQPTYAELVSMETTIAADDADIDTMGYATNATIYGGFKTTEKAGGTAQFVLEPGNTVNSYSVVRSNQVESNDVWMGVWSQMLVGMWGALDLQVNPYSEDKAGNVRVVVHQACDIAVRHPEAFCRGNNTL